MTQGDREMAQGDTVREPEARGPPTAPQGNVMQPSHKHVANRTFVFNARNTTKSGEAEQVARQPHLRGT
jgi:hypothetical protein